MNTILFDGGMQYYLNQIYIDIPLAVKVET